MTPSVRDVVAEITLAEHDDDIVAVAMVIIRKSDGSIRRSSAWAQASHVPALLGGMTLMQHDIAHAIAKHEVKS